MKDLNGVSAVVTGGGSGMGAETARMLVAEGAKVALWDINTNAAQMVAEDIGALCVACDVTSPESVEEALNKTREINGSPRILVNCAGILIGKRVAGRDGAADLDHFEKVIQINLVGTFNVLRVLADEMSKLDTVTESGERGVVINAASIAAFEGQIGQAAYAASKGGIVSMTLPIARELGKFGIRVMAIAPGAVDTEMMQQVPDDIRHNIEQDIPYPKRFAKPEEFASLALHIINNEMLNGEIIRLDGASRLGPK